MVSDGSKNGFIGTIEVDPVAPKPYLLEFKYVGDERVKERMVRVAKYNNARIEFWLLFFRGKWVIRSYQFGKYYSKLYSRFLAYVIDDGEVFSFSKRVTAERALSEIGLLLNDYLERIEKDYNRLLSERESKG